MNYLSQEQGGQNSDQAVGLQHSFPYFDTWVPLPRRFQQVRFLHKSLSASKAHFKYSPASFRLQDSNVLWLQGCREGLENKHGAKSVSITTIGSQNDDSSPGTQRTATPNKIQGSDCKREVAVAIMVVESPTKGVCHASITCSSRAGRGSLQPGPR